MPTSPLASTPPSQLSISYIPPLFANTPTTINLTLTPTVDINSYIVLKFPEGGLSN
jgi:hypothetical protein